MRSVLRGRAFEEPLFAATMVALPIWIAADYVVDFVLPFSCGGVFTSLPSGQGRPQSEAILDSLTIFRAAVIAGNILAAWLVLRSKPFAALFVSLVIVGFFVDFLLEYSHMVGEAFCASFPHISCGPSLSFLPLFLERYDQAFLALFPIQLIWTLRLVIRKRVRQEKPLA